MARYIYMILSTGATGREEEFLNWYKEQHLADIARMDGVVSARLLVPDLQLPSELATPKFTTMSMYELETDNPQACIDAIFAKAGTDAMPLSDAMDMSGLLQLVGHEVLSIG